MGRPRGRREGWLSSAEDVGARERLAYPSGMQLHLELLQVQPLLGLVGIQVVVEVPGGIPEAVELPLGSQQDGGRSLLVGHSRVAPFPSPDTKERQRLWDLPSESQFRPTGENTYCMHDSPRCGSSRELRQARSDSVG